MAAAESASAAELFAATMRKFQQQHNGIDSESIGGSSDEYAAAGAFAGQQQQPRHTHETGGETGPGGFSPIHHHTLLDEFDDSGTNQANDGAAAADTARQFARSLRDALAELDRQQDDAGSDEFQLNDQADSAWQMHEEEDDDDDDENETE